jgi:type I restriction enzyme, S subunit
VTGANERRRVPIQDVYLGLYDGPHATPKPADEGPIFLGIKNITEDGRLDLAEIRHISEAEYPRWTKRVEPQPGDIVFTYDATLNRYAIIPVGFRGCLGRRTALIRPNPAKVDTRFLFYYFFSGEWRSTIAQNMLTGSTVDRIPLTKFPEFRVVLPSLAVQRRIADVLAAYDDLIENNTRRIAILEEMARAIYREWFVDFRFPGHERVEMVESVLGPVPAGWEVVKLSELVRTQYGYTESARDEPVGPKYLRGTDINKRSYIDWSGVPFCPIHSNLIERYRLKVGDILVIRMADPGKVGIVEKVLDAVFASYLIRLEIASDLLSPYYLFYFLSSERYQDYVTGASTGTTRKSASAGVVTDVKIIIPPVDLRERFEQQVSGLRRLLNNLIDQNESLGQTRDLLLPRLISGEIDVSVMEEELAEATA